MSNENENAYTKEEWEAAGRKVESKNHKPLSAATVILALAAAFMAFKTDVFLPDGGLIVCNEVVEACVFVAERGVKLVPVDGFYDLQMAQLRDL